MSENELTPHDLAILELIAGAATTDHYLTELTAGFTAERALDVLNSPASLARFAALATGVTPGLGFKLAAAEHSETGSLNAELLHHALAHRVAATPVRPVQTTKADGQLLIVPPDLANADRTLLAHVQLPDGQLWWHPLRLDEQPIVQHGVPEPSWVAEFGPYWVGHPVARYGLGRWLDRWHPGTGAPDNPFDEGLLHIELGAIAWQLIDYLGSDEAARGWLAGRGEELLQLASRVQGWRGWRRELAGQMFLTAADAYLDLLPGDPQAPRIKQNADALRGLAAIVDLDAYRRRTVAPEVALAAGAAADHTITRGIIKIDPTRVPARSIRRQRPAAVWELVGGPNPELRVRVGVGETPARALKAIVRVAGVKLEVPLQRLGAIYLGALPFDYPVAGLDVEVVGPTVDGPPLAPEERDVLWADIEDIVDTRQEIYVDLAALGIESAILVDRPFVAEIVAWDPDL